MNEKQMLFAYDRRRTSTLTVDEQPGAHTGATRKYIPGYSDSNIVFLNTDTGNDGNTGASIAQAVLTYAQAATLAGSTKKIRLVNSATLSVNITKPTEATIGTTSTIASSSLTAPVNVWTQSTTFNGYSAVQRGLVWVPWLSKFYATGGSSKLYSSPDGVTWTAVAGHGYGSDAPYAICISQSNKLIFTVGSGGKFGYSSDGTTFTVSSPSSAYTNVYNGIDFDETTGTIVICGSEGQISSSVDIGITWFSQRIDISLVFYAVAKSSTRWVVTSTADEIYYSDDSRIWTRVATSASAAWVSLIYSHVASKFVIGDESGIIYYSSNGTTWTAAATPSFGGSNVYGFAESLDMGKIIAVGAGGKIAYSSDANTFTQAGTPSYGASDVICAAWSPLLQKFCTGGNSKAAFSTAYATTISADVAGFSIANVTYSGTVAAYNCTITYAGTTAALSLDSSRVTGEAHISNNAAKSRATLYRGDRHLTCTPAAQNAIDLNLDTWGGTWYIYNASQTGFERIRDCLGAGPIVANYPVTVTGRANIEGELVNVLTGAEVSFNDVSFVDTTDYKLEFQTNGYARNSFAVGRSNLYFNSAGDARDIGAWSYVESAVSYYFAKSEPIYKGEIQHGLDFQLNEQQGDSGVVSVYGNTRRVKEVVTITYGTTYQREKEIFEYMLTLTDKTVKIQIDPEWDSNPGSVVVNGNQSAGSEFLTVDSTAYYEGMWLTIAGKQYWVMRAAPSPSAATKLILDRSLEDAVTDNDVITRNYPAGSGEYQFSGPTGLTLKRVDPTTLRGYYTGFQIRLVRKKQ